MNKKEFDKKFTYTSLDGNIYIIPKYTKDIWQWIEQQIKQARIDELRSVVKELVKDQEPVDILDLLKVINKRIKELTGV